MMPILLALLVVAFLARWFVTDWRENTALPPAPELGRLRAEVDELHAEVQRLTEAQTFMLRLLTDGRTPGEAPPESAGEIHPLPRPEDPDGHS